MKLKQLPTVVKGIEETGEWLFPVMSQADQKIMEWIDGMYGLITSPSLIEIEKKEISRYYLSTQPYLHLQIVKDWIKEAVAAIWLISKASQTEKNYFDCISFFISITKNLLALDLLKEAKWQEAAKEVIQICESKESPTKEKTSPLDCYAAFFKQEKELLEKLGDLQKSVQLSLS